MWSILLALSPSSSSSETEMPPYFYTLSIVEATSLSRTMILSVKHKRIEECEAASFILCCFENATVLSPNSNFVLSLYRCTMPKVCARPLLFRDVSHMLGGLHSSAAEPRPYLAAYGVIGMYVWISMACTCGWGVSKNLVLLILLTYPTSSFDRSIKRTSWKVSKKLVGKTKERQKLVFLIGGGEG